MSSFVTCIAMGVTSGTGSAYPDLGLGVHSIFSEVRVAQAYDI